MNENRETESTLKNRKLSSSDNEYLKRFDHNINNETVDKRMGVLDQAMTTMYEVFDVNKKISKLDIALLIILWVFTAYTIVADRLTDDNEYISPKGKFIINLLVPIITASISTIKTVQVIIEKQEQNEWVAERKKVKKKYDETKTVIHDWLTNYMNLRFKLLEVCSERDELKEQLRDFSVRMISVSPNDTLNDSLNKTSTVEESVSQNEMDKLGMKYSNSHNFLSLNTNKNPSTEFDFIQKIHALSLKNTRRKNIADIESNIAKSASLFIDKVRSENDITKISSPLIRNDDFKSSSSSTKQHEIKRDKYDDAIVPSSKSGSEQTSE